MSDISEPDIQVGTLVRFKCHRNVLAAYHHVEAIVYHISAEKKVWFYFPTPVTAFEYGFMNMKETKGVVEDLGTSPKYIWGAKYPILAKYWDREHHDR